VTAAFPDLVSAYFASRRWFSGKGRTFSVTQLRPLEWRSTVEPGARIEIVTVQYDDGKQDLYQFPVVYRDSVDPEMGHALVGELEHPELGKVVAYDGVYFKSAAEALLDGFHRQTSDDSVSFHVLDEAVLPALSVPGSVMTQEQSNTSIAYGEDAILKLYRRLSPGGNPDIDVHRALTQKGSTHVAPLLGWIESEWQDFDGSARRGHLGMLQVFLRTGTDGWDIALVSVRDLLVEEDLHPEEVGGDFAGEAWRLGEATAEVHADLAVLFETDTLSGPQLAHLGEAMSLRLDTAMVAVPELAEYAPRLRSHYAAIADLDDPIGVQRIHGDLHLGQTLRTVKGWKILDFEGEPAKSLSERVALDSPLRDVAGMLRSFDYAAGATLRQFGTGEHLSYRANEWSARNREAFVEGYASAAGEKPDDRRVLLRAYETDKAVYEAVYEARNRPLWLSIPLQAIARLAAEEVS
jgi:maltokinase